jgi:hypothetical protein
LRHVKSPVAPKITSTVGPGRNSPDDPRDALI